MKKLLLFVLAATALAACSTDTTQDLAPEIPTAPDELQVSFDEEDTRIQLGDAGAPVWTEGDLVSVFYRSNAHDKYEFTGETGDTGGTLKRVSQGTPTVGLDKVVAIYPYNENYLLSLLSGNIKASLPAEQTYLADSYGLGSSIMISSSKTDRLYMRNVCGWLKLQFTGADTAIKKIVLRGNNDEQVAGDIYICSDDASCTLASDLTGADGVNSGDLEGTLVGTNTIITSVTLNCGDGVALNSETPTAFYVALPPQTFEKGITVEILDANTSKMTKSTDKEVVISRNTILPMEVVEFEQTEPKTNEVWYTATERVEPNETEVFGANIVSNEWDSTTGEGIITFDGDVTTIGDDAFYYCTSLTSVTIPDSVTTIGNSAFQYCSKLTSVTIPDSVTTIGDSAFYNCTWLRSVTIPDSVTTIGDYAFYSCTSLTSVTIPDSVTTIGNGAFRSCSKLTAFYGKFASADNRCLIVDGVLKAFAPAGLTKYTIPDSVTTIGDWAFGDCDALTSVTIPDSVTTIGDRAFSFCTWLRSVTIPDSVTTIGDYAFYYCTFLGSVTIPDSVTTIGYRAFRDCDALISVTIGNSVTTIGSEAFYYCDALKSVTIPDSVTTIGDSAFYYCTSLRSVTIPDSVTTIGMAAFRGCSALTSVTIGNSVTTIGGYAFQYCFALKEVYCKPTTPPSLGGSYVFSNNASDRKIYVPTASVDAYKAATNWSEYASAIYPYTFTE